MQKWNNLLVVLSTCLLIFVTMCAAVRVLAFAPHTELLFALGGLVAYALDPVVEWVRQIQFRNAKRVVTRELSVAIVMVGLLFFAGLALWGLEGRVAFEMRTIQTRLPTYRDRAFARAESIDSALAAHSIRFSVVNAIKHPPPEIQSVISPFGETVVRLLTHFAVAVGESIIVLLIAAYFLIYGSNMRERFNARLSPDLRTRIEYWQVDVSRVLGGFVRGQLIIALVIGVAAAVGCLAIGIKVWLIIGVFATFTALIPVFGPYIGIIPALVAAIVGPTHLHNALTSAIAVLVYFTIVNEIGSKVLYPRLVGAVLGLHAALVLFVLFAGLEIGGVVGVLFAAPITALVFISVAHLFRLWQDMPDTLLTNSVVAAESEASAGRT